MVLDFCRARLLVAPPCSCCLVSRSHLLDVLPVVAQVLENNIALHRTASALICIVTAVPNLVYGCPLALRAALSLSLSRSKDAVLSSVCVSAAGTREMQAIRASPHALVFRLPQSRQAIGWVMDGGDGLRLGLFGLTRPHFLLTFCSLLLTLTSRFAHFYLTFCSQEIAEEWDGKPRSAGRFEWAVHSTAVHSP